VREQALSIGAEFLELKGFNLEEGACGARADARAGAADRTVPGSLSTRHKGAGGYAKEMSKEFLDAEMKLFADQAKARARTQEARGATASPGPLTCVCAAGRGHHHHHGTDSGQEGASADHGGDDQVHEACAANRGSQPARRTI
jgi:hypothetical protein